MKLLKGNIIFTKNADRFDILEDGYLLIDSDQILETAFDLNEKYPEIEVEDYSGHLIMPTFTDLHCHAVQYGNLGMGLDKELLEWLETYTFPEEEKFSQLDYSKKIFDLILKDLIRQGTTRVVFYSSIHQASTELLMEMCHQAGIHAYVGKVNMDQNCSFGLKETTEGSIKATKHIMAISFPTVKGIITPRFVPSCSSDLLKALGEIAESGYPVQTHLSENKDEIAWVKRLHPNKKDYLSVYDSYHLVHEKTLLAHCVFCTPDEIELIKERNAFVVHCPSANNNLISGLMPLRKYLDKEIKVGLGTDVGAGHTLSMLETMVQSIQMSKVYHMNHKDLRPISLSEAFFMATKGGGQYFGLHGSFEKNYCSDFMILKPDPIESIKQISPLESLEKFIYTNDQSRIMKIYAKGKCLIDKNRIK